MQAASGAGKKRRRPNNEARSRLHPRKKQRPVGNPSGAWSWLGWEAEEDDCPVQRHKTEANRKLRELLTSLDKGIPIGTQKITFGQWLGKWMRDYVVNKRQKTIERYEGLIERHIAPYLGHVELTMLTPSDIQALEVKLLAKGMAPAGVELVHNVISGAYKYALRMEVAWRNPAKAVTPPKVVRKEVEPPEIARVKEILRLAEEEEA